MDLLLKNKVIVTTGSSKGLGMACAQALLEEDAEVIISSRSLEHLESASTALFKNCGKLPHIYQVDVSHKEEIEVFKEKIIKKHGRVDGLLINAGGPPTGDCLDVDEEMWQQSLGTNLLSEVWLTKAFVPEMIKEYLDI